MSTAIKLQNITIHPVIESQGPFFDAMDVVVRGEHGLHFCGDAGILGNALPTSD
jgi:hypothetical protein